LLVVWLVATPARASGEAPADRAQQAPDSIRVLEIAPLPPEDSREPETEEADRRRLKQTLQRMGRREVEGQHRWERKKSGKVAMLSSALLPGLGQLYNGRRIKVAVMTAVAYSYAAQIWLNWKSAQRAKVARDRLEPGTTAFNFQNVLSEYYEDEARTWGWWFGAVWIIGILDAWTDAHLYDIRAYTPPDQTLSRAAPQRPRTRYLAVTFDF
jgi:hypothetical protein